jgi:hypothetical protein
VVYLCGDGTRGCHGWVTEHPKLASEEGFHVKPWQLPGDVPILLHKRLSRRLTCNGSGYASSDQGTETHIEGHDIDWSADNNGDWDSDF